MEYTESENLETAEEENGTLEVRRLTFTEAVMLVVGATIGSGVLGLAYASRKAGWPVLITWLLAAGFLSVASMLYVAETALRTRRPLQLSGLAEKYVGKAGSWLIFFSVGATSFCSLIAYITGCGKILSTFLGLPLEEASLLFSIGATAVVWLGLKVTGAAEKFLGLGMILMLVLLVGASFLRARVSLDEILYAHWTWGIPVFNIAVFCYAVQYIVPELARGFRDRPEKLVPAILGGTGISFLILSLVPLAVFLMLPGKEITEVASLSWGRALENPLFYLLVNFFAFCAMLTSFWAIAESFLTNCIERLGFRSERDIRSRALCLAFIVIPPIFLASSGLVGFVSAIFSAGTFGGIIMSVLPVFMLRSARKKGDQEPCWQCGWLAARPIQELVLVVFLASGVYALLSMAGMLPKGW
ncbi:aromatic amino acid transport family protein [uncultured Acidaminococcus sp.]|uniref:aromatic amino acid transport family protein n=1 Tax=uncultured Acidaminococcus sp. TaxID=352152 RepID=UPI00266F6D61|nr:aromatic amino acid transport family protein [uncultured Acidaminococcus sp.]